MIEGGCLCGACRYGTDDDNPAAGQNLEALQSVIAANGPHDGMR